MLPDEADAYTNFCGHTYTTGNCPAPTGLPRIDRERLSAARQRRRAGRRPRAAGQRRGQPVDAHGHVLTDADGVPLAPAPRTKTCETAGKDYGIKLRLEGPGTAAAAARCAGSATAAARPNVRVNGDAALVGYCYPGHHVFCVTYFETSMPC